MQAFECLGGFWVFCSVINEKLFMGDFMHLSLKGEKKPVNVTREFLKFLNWKILRRVIESNPWCTIQILTYNILRPWKQGWILSTISTYNLHTLGFGKHLGTWSILYKARTSFALKWSKSLMWIYFEDFFFSFFFWKTFWGNLSL